jgi:ribosome-binding protein aMBF1 (putative translation factor)
VVERITTYAGVKKVAGADGPTTEQQFGQAVRARRLDRGWSQQALSDELRKNGVELHQTGVGRLEAGTRGTGLNEAEAIAELLGLDRSEWQS